jgi:hypothetical protein
MIGFEKLKGLFFRYMHCYVVNNDYLILLLFHLLIGVILTKIGIRILINKEISPRDSLFTIQTSGTGKGEAMDAMARLVIRVNEKLGNDSLYKLGLAHRMTDFTTAGWIGTIEKVNNQIQVIEGSLKTKDIILVPEGKALFESTEYTRDIRHKLNSALDEPGILTKRLRLGEFTYESFTSIAVATIPLSEVNFSLAREGFLQRFLISYKEFSEKEKNDIDKEKSKLKQLNYVTDIIPILDELTDNLVLLIKSLKWWMFTNSLVIRKEDIPLIERMRINLRERYFRHQYGDERSNIMDSFYERLDVHLLKIAGHRTVLEGRSEITAKDYGYAAQTLEWHCESIGRLLDKLTYFREDETKRRKSIILQIIKSNGGSISRAEIIGILEEMYKRRTWNLGRTRTHQFIKSMVEGGDLKFRMEAKGRKVLLLP